MGHKRKKLKNLKNKLKLSFTAQDILWVHPSASVVSDDQHKTAYGYDYD